MAKTKFIQVLPYFIGILVLGGGVAIWSLMLPRAEQFMGGRQPCRYEKFTDTVKVAIIHWEEGYQDSVGSLKLRSTEDKRQVYYLNDVQADDYFKTNRFTASDIKDSLNRFQIKGRRITQGTCSPGDVREMIMLKR